LIPYATLPLLNAVFNSIAAVLLVAGLIFIRRGAVRAHRACMLSAVGVSVAFLVSYITYHAHAGDVRFLGRGLIRPVYFTILITHITLAFVIVPLVIITLWRALAGRFGAHRAIARWTWPIWMYVSVTGVIVYLMVYRLYPHSPIAGLPAARAVAASSSSLPVR
jgi:putative membrane protein